MRVGGDNRLNSASLSRSQGAGKAAQAGAAASTGAASNAGPVAPVGNVDQLCILTDVKGQVSNIEFVSNNVGELNMSSQHMDALSNFCKKMSPEDIENATISSLADKLTNYLFAA